MMGFGLALVLIALAYAAWAILGAASPSTGSNGGNPSGGGCQRCKDLDAWWNGLSALQKVKQAANYAWQKADCAIRC
jgi:hypothetical protein